MVNPELVELLPKVPEGLRYLKKLGFSFGIITNQSVIGRKLATIREVESVNNKVLNLLQQHEVVISFVSVCPHVPEDFCACRKPLPQLGLEAIEKYRIDAESSYMIGDMNLDIAFGQAIGCKTIGITNSTFGNPKPNYTAVDLLSAAKYIHSQMK